MDSSRTKPISNMFVCYLPRAIDSSSDYLKFLYTEQKEGVEKLGLSITKRKYFK